MNSWNSVWKGLSNHPRPGSNEGVAEAMHWLREDIDGVIYMLDATMDPFMQVNIMMIGIIESRKLPVIIVANKIDFAIQSCTDKECIPAAPGRRYLPVWKDAMLKVCTRPCLSASGEGYAAQMHEMRTGI